MREKKETMLKRIKKKDELSEAEAENVKCPVYKCEKTFHADLELAAHYKEDHKDLINLGLAVGTDHKDSLKAAIKDTLLTQLTCFALLNKNQVKRFQIDYDQEEEK